VRIWWHTPEMLDEKIINKSELKKYLKYLGEISKSARNWSNHTKAATIGSILVDKGVLTENEFIDTF
jgi:hypothetical protein